MLVRIVDMTNTEQFSVRKGLWILYGARKFVCCKHNPSLQRFVGEEGSIQPILLIIILYLHIHLNHLLKKQ